MSQQRVIQLIQAVTMSGILIAALPLTCCDEVWCATFAAVR